MRESVGEERRGRGSEKRGGGDREGEAQKRKRMDKREGEVKRMDVRGRGQIPQNGLSEVNVIENVSYESFRAGEGRLIFREKLELSEVLIWQSH